MGSNDFTIVIHGKPDHEETRATFSHASANGPAIVIADFKEADLLAQMLKGGVNTQSKSMRFGICLRAVLLKVLILQFILIELV